MTQNQLNIVETPEIDDMKDKFSSEALLKLFITDCLNRKEKERIKKDNQ